MKRLAFILALLCGSAWADLVATEGASSLRLKQEPCPLEILRLLPEGTRGYFQRAEAVIEGTPFAACWAVTPRGVVVLKFSDDDDGEVPITAFEQE